jgi:hypothetical protein
MDDQSEGHSPAARVISHCTAAACFAGAAAAVVSLAGGVSPIAWAVGAGYPVCVAFLVGPFLLLGLATRQRRLPAAGQVTLLVPALLLGGLSVLDLLTPDGEGNHDPDVARALFRMFLAFVGDGVAAVALLVAASLSAGGDTPEPAAPGA